MANASHVEVPAMQHIHLQGLQIKPMRSIVDLPRLRLVWSDLDCYTSRPDQFV